MNSAALKYPFPYKAWLTMANDPDNTVIEDWRELHSFIWEELKLPFGDSLFVRSFNQNLPDQVDLAKFPEIGKAHFHDIIHTWGDYMHGRKRGFDREDAMEAAKILVDAGILPKVWIDHASFVGNMIHGTNKGSMDKLVDSSGHVYQNFVYSLDIARKLGIRFVWNGEVTAVVGQDRDMQFDDHKTQSGGSGLKATLKSSLQQLPGGSALYASPDNKQYHKHEFKDGSEMYCFKRFGTWPDADIDGLHNLINPEIIDKLLSTGGTAVVYTHLGKRHSSGKDRKQHIPASTRADLLNLKEKFDSKELMISPLSQMLEYLVLRDHIQMDPSANQINFRSDGICFIQLRSKDLNGMKFSFIARGWNLDILKVLVDGTEVKPQFVSESNEVFSIVF